jgi:vacuolar-type H+-ATPase subunit H
MKLSLGVTPLATDDNKPARVALMEIISAEGNMDEAFNRLAESKYDEALTAIDEAEKSLHGARAALQQARADAIRRRSSN